MAAARPNVIVIMADDIGAEGLGCYGSQIYTTPNLDRMASEGVRFESAYSTPLCTPTRVMIMSGLFPNRTGFKALIGKGPGVRMPATIKTFGHYFRDAGYQTAIAGKWQLGKFDEHADQPIEHGFDEYCMWSWFYKGKKTKRYYGPHYHQDGKPIQGTEEDYGPDYYSQYVLDFIDRNKAKPFFIYYPMALVHSPFVHPPQLEALARTKFADDLPKATKAFGHMITYMDNIIGQIMSRLAAHGIDRNTLVLFTGDNGTHKSITSRLPGIDVTGGKGSMTEAGCRVPLLAWWPGRIRPAVRDEFFCLVDCLPTIVSIAGIELTAKVDGMDLSHLFLGKQGENREHVLMSYGKGFFIRNERFRLHEDGTLYDIPVTSDRTRYSEAVIARPANDPRRQRLQGILNDFMAIRDDYGGATKSSTQGTGKKTKEGKKPTPQT
jgi:arylsulfatase A